MKEVNAAYEEIQRRRKAGETGNDPYGAYGGGQTYSQSGAQSPTYAAIRSCVNSGDLDQAHRLLMAVAQSDRGAEWNFLMGCVLLLMAENGEAPSEAEQKLAQTVAGFLGKQMES
jgi:molecular chaperone DnaJ